MANFSGNRWPGRLIRFGFPDVDFRWMGDLRADGYPRSFLDDWEPAPARIVDAHRLIFATVGDQLGLRLEEVEPEDAQIRVAMSGYVKRWGYGFRPGKRLHRSGSIFHALELAEADWSPGRRVFCHGLHECGHSLGLSHSEGATNSIDVSVMATNWPDREEYPDRLLPHDVAVLRALYRRQD
ncbi:MAG: Matrixin [Microvirga sp.]|jgi:hypothetical protein|nr:Matrixin [Microvirga sp.]